MKVTYFSYQLQRNDQLHLHNIVPLLRKFISNSNNEMKGSFVNKNDDSVFLFPITQNCYALMVTKDNELIKKINSSEVTYNDIRNDLNENEKIGFASYVMVDQDHYAIASTVQGPKNKTFTDFINQLLKKLHLDIEFQCSPFPSKITQDDAVELEFIGRTTFDISPENNVFLDLKNMLGMGNLPDELNSIQVIIKPVAGKNIKESIPELNSILGHEGVNKYLLRAKNNLQETVSDFYITGNGFLSDTILNDEQTIARQINQKKSENTLLSNKLSELRNDERYTNEQIESLSPYNNDSAWSELLSTYYSN